MDFLQSEVSGNLLARWGHSGLVHYGHAKPGACKEKILEKSMTIPTIPDPHDAAVILKDIQTELQSEPDTSVIKRLTAVCASLAAQIDEQNRRWHEQVANRNAMF